MDWFGRGSRLQMPWLAADMFRLVWEGWNEPVPLRTPAPLVRQVNLAVFVS
jgi:hypothetical protein